MAYNKNTNWENEEKYLDNLAKTGNAGQKAWAEQQKKVLASAKAQYGTNTTTTPSSSYNANTNWANEEKYLDNLSKTGNAGQQAWANNQKNVLASAKSQYTPMASNTPSTPVITPSSHTFIPIGTYDDSGLPQEVKDKVEFYQAMWLDYIKQGNTEGAAAAHKAAESLRSQYGYSGGEDGSDYIELPTPPTQTPSIPAPSVVTPPTVEVPNFTPPITSGDMQGWNDQYNTETPAPVAPERDPRIEQLLNEILTRGDFSYDAASDPLYKQYANMYNREGDRAMRETMAEAAAFAGGMNSYAITAAQQAQNYYNSQLNDRIPELYQLAYQMYLQDKESKVQDLGILSELDSEQYNRYRDTMADWRNDKSFAYGTMQDAVSQGNYETNLKNSDFWKATDFNNSNFWSATELNNENYWKDKSWTSSEQESAKDEVWKLINLGVTPSADLIAKAGMNETDVKLAVAAMQAGGGSGSGSGSGSGNNGYTGGGSSSSSSSSSGGNGYTGNNAGFTGNNGNTGITEEIRKKAESFRTNEELGLWLDSLNNAGHLTTEEVDILMNEYADSNEVYKKDESGNNTSDYSYSDMVKSTRDWEVVDDGGANLFGIDKDAIVVSPNGEQMTLKNLRERLKSEGMSQSEANKAIKALQQDLKISSNWMFGW